MGELEQTYKTLPERSSKAKSRFSILKSPFSTVHHREASPGSRGSSPGKTARSRFSICKSPIVTDEASGALIEFSTGRDVAIMSSHTNDITSPIPFANKAPSKFKHSQGDWNTPDILLPSSERIGERRLRRVTETEEPTADLPSPTKSMQQKPKIEAIKETVMAASPKVSRFSITRSPLPPEQNDANDKSDLSEHNSPTSSNTGAQKSRFLIINTSSPSPTEPNGCNTKAIASNEGLMAPRKSLLKHSISVDAAQGDGASSGSSSCSSVGGSNRHLNRSSVLKQHTAGSTASPARVDKTNVKTSNVSFGKEVIYLDGNPLGTPPPQSRVRSRSDAAATLLKLKTASSKPQKYSTSKLPWLREKHQAMKQSKEDVTKVENKVHKRTQSCDVEQSIVTAPKDDKSIDRTLDKPPDKPRNRTRSDGAKFKAKPKVVLEEVSTKSSFDWPLGRLGKLRQKYTKKKEMDSKSSTSQKSKGSQDLLQKETNLGHKCKSLEGIGKRQEETAKNIMIAEGKDEVDDMVYELPTHYQTVLPVIKSRVIRPVMGLFRQNSSKSKLKKNKRDRQRHATDSEAGSRHS